MNSLPTIRATFLLMAAVLAGSLAVTYWIGQQSIKQSLQISARETSLRELQQVFSTIQDAETGQRGFLLTRRAEYLAPYSAALDELPARIRHLRNAAQHGEFPSELAERLHGLTDEKMRELGRTVDLAQGQKIESALNVVMTDEGKQRMDAIRRTFDEIVQYERTSLAEAESLSIFLVKVRTWVFVVAVLINLGFLTWAYRRIRREISRRYVADLETRRQREILAVSLASIGDAVILTDTETRIMFMNEAAEELTGWKRSDAEGQPCARVFRIVNEDSRATVESPVNLVLRTGKVVGLANHTLLIRKDGREIPIDDSGAPVREPDGEVRGVVLVFRDFSKHKNSERELLDTKHRLEVASQAKDDFLATLSHELRTPLTPVLATLSSWEANRALPSPLIEDVRMLSRNVRLEVRLIDDLLDLTRITRGQITLHREHVDAHSLLAAVVEIFRVETEQKQIRIGVRTAAGRHFVDGDPARLQQVFWNIIGNAVKHTPSGGRIEIVTSNQEGNLVVTIADNGRGMAPEQLARLFLPFARTVPRAGYQPSGLGIGLTISQNLMRAHDGGIEARSAGEGLGSTFTVRMSALPTNPVSPPAVAEKNGSVQTPLSILLVEDHEDSATVIARIVRNMGHSVAVSHNVTDALRELRGGSFDLVLSDIGLPDGTGLELLAQAREFSKVPMIALTGFGMEDDLAKYRAAGFRHQLTKPIRFDQLETLLIEFASEAKAVGRSGLTVHAPSAGNGQ